MLVGGSGGRSLALLLRRALRCVMTLYPPALGVFISTTSASRMRRPSRTTPGEGWLRNVSVSFTSACCASASNQPILVTRTSSWISAARARQRGRQGWRS